MADRQRVGVAGLGHMGSRVAQRLLAAGNDVVVWDRNREASGALVAQGAQAAGSPVELAAQVDVVFTVLTNDDAVRNVVFESGLLAALPDGALFADLSTISIDLAVELADAAKEAGIAFLDVEMSGSTPQVESGTLVLFIGGDAATLERARPLLEPLSKSIWHMGDYGAGAKMKLVVNTLLGVGMEALAEAIVFGEAVGLDRDRMLDALDEVAAIAPAHKPKLQNARTGEYPATFPLRLMSKDFELILAAAKDAGVELPATAASAKTSADALESADDDVDFSAVIKTLEQQLDGA